jgi:hypothetical protein
MSVASRNRVDIVVLRGEGKADKFLAALALATAWCYAFWKWHVA